MATVVKMPRWIVKTEGVGIIKPIPVIVSAYRVEKFVRIGLVPLIMIVRRIWDLVINAIQQKVFVKYNVAVIKPMLKIMGVARMTDYGTVDVVLLQMVLKYKR